MSGVAQETLHYQEKEICNHYPEENKKAFFFIERP